MSKREADGPSQEGGRKRVRLVQAVVNGAPQIRAGRIGAIDLLRQVARERDQLYGMLAGATAQLRERDETIRNMQLCNRQLIGHVQDRERLLAERPLMYHQTILENSLLLNLILSGIIEVPTLLNQMGNFIPGSMPNVFNGVIRNVAEMLNSPARIEVNEEVDKEKEKEEVEEEVDVESLDETVGNDNGVDPPNLDDLQWQYSKNVVKKEQEDGGKDGVRSDDSIIKNVSIASTV